MPDKTMVKRARPYFRREVDQRDVRWVTLELECGHTVDRPGAARVEGSNPPRYRDKTYPAAPIPDAVVCADCPDGTLF